MSNFSHDYDRRDYIFLTPRHIGDTRDMTMQDKLLRAAWNATHDESEPWDSALAIEKHPYVLELDAILREQRAIAVERCKANIPAAMKQEWAGLITRVRNILDEPQQEDDAA